jgi:outer membrane protein assembly factor BamB
MMYPMLDRWIFSFCVAALVCAEGLVPRALAADWPQWGGTDSRNLVSAETGLPDTFAPGNKNPDSSGIDPATTKNVKWTARLGSAAYGNPTVAGGRVFVGTDDALPDDPRFKRANGGLLRCFDEADGHVLWQLAVPERGNLPKDLHFTHQYLGICSSPTVEGDRVYVVTCADEVLCLDVHGQANGNDGSFQDEGQYMVGPDKPPVQLGPSDADIIWRLDLIDELGIRPHDAASCSILIHGDLLYLSTSNGVEVTHTRILAPEAPAFIAVNKRTGKLAAFENEKLSARLYHAQWCSPSLGKVGNRTLVFLGGGDGVCYAFEALEEVPEKPAPLKIVWSFDAIPPEYKYRDGKAIPYYDGDKRKSNGPNKNDGTFVGPSEIIGTPVFADGRVYFAIGQDPAHGRGRGMLYCVDASGTGDITKTGCVWRYDGLDRSLSTVAVGDGLVYAMDVAGRLHCVDAATGKLCWVEDTKAEAWGGPLVADGKLFFGNKKDFYIMRAGREPRILSKIRLGAHVYSTPVAANGTVFVASERYLWAVMKNGK